MELLNDPIVLSDEIVIGKIYWVRNCRVLLDTDLAQLYGVEVKRLKESVRRNIKRFPNDFVFELTKEEHQSLRSQFASLKRGKHSKYHSFAFTEQGVAMLSGVLNSDRAIAVNIAIMRAFVQLRQFMESNKELSMKIADLEQAVITHDKDIQVIFQTIRHLIEHKEEPPVQRNPIGYRK
jgi:hypothetical protein